MESAETDFSKGLAGEHERQQKKAFTMWINSHLAKVGEEVNDLYEDLRDGRKLLKLIELITGDKLKPEKRDMRVHHKLNIKKVIDYLSTKNIDLIGVNTEAIVDGEQRPTLGLIWKLVFHFQITMIPRRKRLNSTPKSPTDSKAAKFKYKLLNWARSATEGYGIAQVANFHTFWQDGLAFCAIIDRHRPDLLNYEECRSNTPSTNLELAMGVAEKELKIVKLIDPQDICDSKPNEDVMMTYISCFRDAFPVTPKSRPLRASMVEVKPLASEVVAVFSEPMSCVTMANVPMSKATAVSTKPVSTLTIYSPPATKVTMSCTADYEVHPPAEEVVCWAIVTLKAPCIARVPVDIVAVIDKSGSMSGEKLDLIKKTLFFFVDHMKDDDRLSLVSYDTCVYLDFSLTPMSEDDKEGTKSTISKLCSGSCTNLCGGLIKGMEQVTQSTSEKAHVKSVMLLTDGLANVGNSSTDGILAEIKKHQQPPEGGHMQKFEGTIYTFGFGSDHDSNLLEAISRQGGGVYYYIDSVDKISESFADCLGGLMCVAGQNLMVNIEAVGMTSIAAVHAHNSPQWNIHEKSCKIQLGDIQSEEERDIVLQLSLPAVEPGQEDQGPVLEVTLNYFDILSSRVAENITSELIVHRRDVEYGDPNQDVDKHKSRIKTVAAFKEADRLAKRRLFDEARKVLSDAIIDLEKTHTASSDFCKALLEDLRMGLESIKSQEEYNKHGRLFIVSKIQTHSMQRSNFVDHNDYYQNCLKANFRVLSVK